MDFQKYIKYKIKYKDLKNHNGGMIETTTTQYTTRCDDIITFTNKIGICWYISILLIFIFGDTTRDVIQRALVNPDTENQITESDTMLKTLLKNIYDKTNLINLILLIKQKFEIKMDKINNKQDERKFIRQDSYNKSEEISLLYNKIFNYENTSTSGGSYYDMYFFTNILSSVLLNKFIKFNIINKYTDLIDINLVNKSIGIFIIVKGHVCCFFKCNNNLMYSSNSVSFKYNWLQLFNKYNKLINSNIEFKIYINILNDVGPIIITETNKIYNYNESKNKQVKQQLYEHPINYIDITSTSNIILTLEYFTILTFYNNDKFIENNNILHLSYYSAKNNIIKIKEILYNNDTTEYDLNNLFIKAFNDKKIHILSLILHYDKYVDIDYNLIYDDNTLFFDACENNNTEIVKLFLDSNKEIDYNLSYNEISPFYIACDNNNIEMVKLFLDSDKQIDYNLSFNNVSPFYLICENNNTELVKLFLDSDKQIDYNFLYNEKFPFYIAFINNNIEMVKLFLNSDKQIDYNLLYNEKSVFYNACYIKNKTDMVKLFLYSNKEIDYNLSFNGITPFYTVCYNNNTELVKLFLYSNKNIDYKLSFNSISPFFTVCKNNNTELVKLFLYSNKEIDYNLPYKGVTPFYIACNNNNIEMVKLFLYSNKQIDYNSGNNEETPFYIACTINNTEMVKLFLYSNKQLDYNSGYDGASPFFVACANNNIEMVKLFLYSYKENQIEYNLPYKGQTPLDIANEYGYFDIVKLIMDNKKN